MNFKCFGLLAMVCMAVCLCAAEKKSPDKVKAPDTAGDAASGAPDFNNTWALNGPYSLEGLKGKVVVFRFYESG
jgi:hypothetical protein